MDMHQPKTVNPTGPSEEDIIRAVAERVSAKIEANPNIPLRGRCHLVWEEMKQILKAEHNIDWQSPADQNPDILYD